MKSNSDADWDKEVERAKDEDAQLLQRVKARKFLSWDTSALREVGKQFLIICVVGAPIVYVLMNFYVLIAVLTLLPIALLIYHYFDSRS